MLVDFHAHTYESDGTLAPQALCDFMVERGVRYFSITDHDTLGAYGRFEAPAHVRVLPGIEINTTYRESEVHVLGYRLPLGDSPLRAVLERNRQARRERVGRIVDQLRDAGVEIGMEDVEREATPQASLGRPHVGKALVRKGVVASIEGAFRGYLRRGTPGYVPSTHITPHQAIAAIRESGGVAVLAHPGRLKDYDLIDELAPEGLHGLEVFYPTHEVGQIAHFREKARRLGLVMTAGCDFHDIRYHTRGVGYEVDEAAIRPFLELTGLF